MSWLYADPEVTTNLRYDDDKLMVVMTEITKFSPLVMISCVLWSNSCSYLKAKKTLLTASSCTFLVSYSQHSLHALVFTAGVTYSQGLRMV